MSDTITIITNHVPRDLIQAWELTEAERAEFDYHDWANIMGDNPQSSPEFFRYRGQLYDLGEFSADWGITRGTGLPDWLSGWSAYMSDTFFSGIVIRFPVLEPANRYHDTQIDFERVVVGTYYVS